MSAATASNTSQHSNLEGLILRLERGNPQMQLLVRFACLNFFFLFVRPQDWPGLSPVGAIRTPMLVALIVFFLWLPHVNKTWFRISKYMMFFLVFEGFRGLVGRYFDPNDSIVRNDFWQFHTFRDLTIQFMSLGFPIIVSGRSERTLRTICFTLCFCAVLLGLYAITHAGKGPGGFVGDENDNCLVLVMLLPFAVMLRSTFRGGIFRITAISAALLSCVGIVATNSRGGFLGFAAVLALFFLRSDKKLATVAGGVFALLVAFPFIPQEYIKEITSIRSEVSSGEGTIKERFDTWEVSLRVFTDPRNILFGVGMRNVPFWFGDYEDAERGRFVKSLAGRAMHSMYFELLPDLGLYGVFVIGSIIFFSIRGNSRAVEDYERNARPLQILVAQSRGHKSDTPSLLTPQQLSAARRLLNQCRIGREVAKALNVSWLGTLVAAIGVSVLYYPPIWFLTCLSVAVQAHAATLVEAARIFEATATGTTEAETPSAPA